MTDRSRPLPAVPGPLTRIAARLYGLGWRLDVRRQLRGGPARLEVPVLSIGNLTVGGTGKTPFCGHLAASLRKAGASPAIALRGYRGDRTGGSDEAAEYRDQHPWLPLVIGADRTGEARSRLREEPGAFDVLLLDDGFQHRRLHRDLDIVLVDAMRPGLDGDLLPHGWLREPARSLERADVVVITRADQGVERAEALVERHRGRPAEVVCRHVWGHLDRFSGTRHEGTEPIEALSGRRLVVCSGLGNPAHLLRQVEASGATIVDHLANPDHARYGARELAAIEAACAQGDALLTSGKDWVKLREGLEARSFGVPVLVPRVRIEFDRGADRLAEAIGAAAGREPVL